MKRKFLALCHIYVRKFYTLWVKMAQISYYGMGLVSIYFIKVVEEAYTKEWLIFVQLYRSKGVILKGGLYQWLYSKQL